jgi:hypothetical protein
MGIVLILRISLGIMDQKQDGPLSPHPAQTVYNDGWDGAVRQVKGYLKENLKDPDSLQFIEWGKVVTEGSGYAIRCKYRAKNSFGGYEIEHTLFRLNSAGQVTSVKDYP